MLYLLNNVIVNTRDAVPLPRGLESLRDLMPEGVLRAGEELYRKHPTLETERPDIAEWFCALLAAKFPAGNAAMIKPLEGGRKVGACIAAVPLPTLAQLWKFQCDGDQIEIEVFRNLWLKARPVA